jgi:hypothetical protein
MNDQAPEGFWTYSDGGDLEYRSTENQELIETMPFAKARSLAAFILWHVIESFGSEE